MLRRPWPDTQLLRWPLWAAAFALLILHLIVYLDHAWALALYPFGIDQGEGYDAYAGWLINLGRWIYTDNGLYPYFSSNYPPLYAYVISIPMAWFGPSIGLARLVSILASVGSGGLIAWLVWRESRRSPPAACAALLFFASTYVFHTTPLARVNATTLLFALAALAVLERARGWRLAWAAVLFLAALFTKQTSIDAFMAGSIWLLLRGRGQEAVRLGLSVGGIGLALFAGLEWLSGGQFWTNVVLGNANPWDPGQAVGYYANFVQLHLVVVCLAAIKLRQEIRSGPPSLMGVYFGVSAVLALSVGKWGAGESYFLGTIAASCVLAGRLIATIPWSATAQPLLALAVAAQSGLFAHGSLAAVLRQAQDERGGQHVSVQAVELGWKPDAQDLAAGRRLLSYVEKFGGPVLAEDPGFLVQSTKPIVGNATHLRNLWLAGAWDASELVGEIEALRFDYIILDAHLYPPPVLEAVGRYYYLHDRVALRHREYLVFAPGGG